MQEELKFLKKNLKPNESVVIAVSGGPDSMCLLDLVIFLKKELNLKIICAHVNHKIRVESDKEAIMVKEFAINHDCIFELLEINEYIDNKFSESDARKKRYNFFRNIMKKYQSTTLLTAHHGDDLIETILMRITRGSNLNGYIGIKQVSKNSDYKTLRPLLTTSKDNIISYLEEKNIPYAIDKSNESNDYTRNRYRNKILPFLKKENPKVHEKYLKFSKELEEYEQFINKYIKDKRIIVDNLIDINKIKDESNFIKRKSIEQLVKKIQEKDYFDINDKEMNDLIKLLDKDNKQIDLNNFYQGINSYGKFQIKKRETKNFEELILDKDISINEFKFYYNCEYGNNTNSCIYLNSSEISLPLKIRPWQIKDKMKVKNLNGTKLLSDIFINSKIPKLKRQTYPVLVDNKNTILWLPNLKKSQFCKDKSEKYDIIIKCEADEK